MVSDVSAPDIEVVEAGLGLLVGDLDLSSYEDELSARWPECLHGAGTRTAGGKGSFLQGK